jgi:hypothetical protein
MFASGSMSPGADNHEKVAEGQGGKVAEGQSCKVAEMHVVNPATLQPCNPIIFASGNMPPGTNNDEKNDVSGRRRMSPHTFLGRFSRSAATSALRSFTIRSLRFTIYHFQNRQHACDTYNE